jgi:photosynthetic reaction center H subunit
VDVKELIADTSAMKVRYLDIELDSDLQASDDESRVLVPIEHARLIEDDDVVRLDAVASHQARDIPTHRGTFDRDYEGA